jgi:hypothetical protein
MRFNVKAFALTCGIFWAVSLFLITWWMILFHGVSDARTFISWFYIGYSISPLGSVIGLVWAFFDGLIAGAIFAWLYNLLAGRNVE